MNWLNSLAGLFVGALVGATGVGGGAVMTPLLVLLLGVVPHTAIGTDLLYASATKVFGVGVHGFQGRVDWQIVRRLALGSLPAAIATLAWLHSTGSQGLRGGTILLVLGVVLILSALSTVLMPMLIRKVAQKGFVTPALFTRNQPVLTVLAAGTYCCAQVIIRNGTVELMVCWNANSFQATASVGIRMPRRRRMMRRKSAAVSDRAEMKVSGGIEPRPILASG